MSICTATYTSAPITFFPLNPANPLDFTTAQMHDFRRQVVSGVWCDDYARFEAAPTGFVTDSREFGSILKQKRTSVPRLSIPKQAQAIGMSPRAYHKLEEKGQLGNQLGHVQTLAYLYQIRFNFLPFLGTPLCFSNKCLIDIIIRALTVQLDPNSQEFEAVMKMDFEEIQRRTATRSLTQPLHNSLTQKLHTRLWPPAKRRLIKLTPQTEGQFLNDLRSLLTLWGMTQDDFGTTVLGVAHGTMRNFLHAPSEFGQIKRTLAPKLGYQCEQKESLDEQRQKLTPLGPLFLNSELVRAIETRRKCLGLSKRAMCKFADTDIKNLAQIYTTLNSPFLDSHKGYIRAMDTLQKICSLLKILVHDHSTLPPLHQHMTGVLQSDISALVSELKDRRVALRLSHNGLIDIVRTLFPDTAGIGKGNKAALKAIEAGNINPRNLIVAEKILRALQIFHDPFEHLEPVRVEASATKEAIKVMIKKRIESSLISNRRLAQLANINTSTLNNFIFGQFSLEHPGFRRLCLILRIHLPSSHHEQVAHKANWLERFDSYLYTNGIRSFQAPHIFGISEDDFFRVKRGDCEPTCAVMLRIDQIINASPYILLGSSQAEWAAHIQEQITKQQNTPQNIQAMIHIAPDKLQNILNGNFYWADPDVWALAKHYKTYTWEMLQAFIEDASGNIDELKDETGLTDKDLATQFFYTNYDLLSPAQAQQRRTREHLLERPLNNIPLRDQDIKFLQISGGSPEEIIQRPLSYVFYLFSLGDLTSLLTYCLHHKISPEVLKEKYQNWVFEMYGLKIKENSIQKTNGKQHEVSFFFSSFLSKLTNHS